MKNDIYLTNIEYHRKRGSGTYVIDNNKIYVKSNGIYTVNFFGQMLTTSTETTCELGVNINFDNVKLRESIILAHCNIKKEDWRRQISLTSPVILNKGDYITIDAYNSFQTETELFLYKDFIFNIKKEV